MSDKSTIEWTDATWNPVTGCDQVSPGCDNCYAKNLAPRLKAMGNPSYQTDGTRKTSGPGFGVALHPQLLDQPLRWKRPRRVFVNSMSDLFHVEVPDYFVADVFIRMALARQHIFQVLTKRPRHMLRVLKSGGFRHAYEEGFRVAGKPIPDEWPLPNVWLGVSVENQKWADQRIPLLMETSAHVRFLSVEPLLGPVDLRPFMNDDFMGGDLEDFIQWVIVGGESGRSARPMHPDWARTLRDQCVSHGIPFFFKQWGQWIPSVDAAEGGASFGAPIFEERALHEDGTECTHDVCHSWRAVGRTNKKSHRELDGRTWDEMPA